MAEVTKRKYTTRISRKALIEMLREEGKRTSFGRMLTLTIYDEVAKTKAERREERRQEKLEEERKTKTKPDIKVRGKTTGNANRFSPNGFYHTVALDFAIGLQGNNTPAPALTDEEKENWGTGFGNPLVNPHGDCIYVVRATIDQLRVDPMVGGFRLQWLWPAGWTPVDDLSHWMYVEASSNPLILMRKFLSPAKAAIKQGQVFRCRVRAWYP